MSSLIPSPLTLDLTNTRAFKTWLYQLWQSSGGSTTTAIDDVDVYLADSSNQNSTDQLEQSLLIQIRDELAGINKRLEETQTTDRIVINEVDKRFDDLRISERQMLEEINKRIDELLIGDRSVIDELSRKIDDVIILLGASL